MNKTRDTLKMANNPQYMQWVFKMKLTYIKKLHKSDLTVYVISKYTPTYPCWQIQCPHITLHKEIQAGSQRLDQ